MDEIIDKFNIREFVELEELNYRNKLDESYKLNDSLILLKIIEKSDKNNWFDILCDIVKKIEGSFSLILT